MQVSAELREAITRELVQARVPGCSIAWGERGAVPSSFEYGYAELPGRRRVEATTSFHLFSGTKLYTATALMLLVERGLVSLDDSVSRHLPELPLRDDLTLRHLASHASGLPDTLRAFLAVHRSDEPAPTTGEALSRYRLDKGKAPGRSAAYRNVNYAILGELISRVSAEPYERFVAREILEPLGADLSFEEPSGGADSALGYVPRLSPMRLLLRLLFPDVAARIVGEVGEGFVSLRPFSLDTAAIGGLVGGANAFFPLTEEMCCPEDGLLRSATKKEMLTLQSRGAAGVVSRDGVGLGWKRGHIGDALFWNHEGGGPGFCSETRIYPGEGVAVVILMNRSQSSSLSRCAHRIAETIRGSISPRS